MLPFKLVYHPGYDLKLGEHVFPSRKYRLIHDQLLDEGSALPWDFVEPQPASDDDVLRVHDAGWVHRLKTGTLSGAEVVRLEIPYSKEMVDGFWLATGGTLLAARNAVQTRIGFNMGGGFHDCDPRATARTNHRTRHGGGLRRPSRQRHGRNLRRRPDGADVVPAPVQ
jgi:acetoin utilization deacetylase AcuC-like enzyme